MSDVPPQTAGDGRVRRSLRWTSRAALLATVLTAAWWMAGVDEWIQAWLAAGVLAAGVLYLASRLGRNPSPRLATCLIPLGLAIGLATVQLLPLPAGVLRVVSPRSSQIHRQMLPAADAADATLVDLPDQNSWRAASLYPDRTRHQWALLVLATLTFFLASVLFETAAAQRWLIFLLAMNGAVLAFFGLIQKLTWNGRFYWIGPATGIDSAFATFVNRNNAGGYLSISLAAALGLAMWAASRGKADRPERRPQSRFDRDSSRLVEFFASLDGPKLFGLGLAIVITAAVFATLSRGAGLALLGALGVVMLAIAGLKQHRSQLAWFVMAAAAGAALLAWAGLAGALQERFDQLKDTERLAGTGRLPNWMDALKAVPDFWPSGSGLGSYAYVYQMYQERFDWGWYYHAENQYIEALVDGGLPGLLLMLSAVALVGYASWRTLRAADDRETFALGVAGCFAVASQAIHAIVDFGLYIPANMLLMATVCGAVCGRAGQLGSDAGRSRLIALPTYALASWTLLLLLTGAVGWGAVELRNMGRAEAITDAATFPQTPAGASVGQLLAAIEQLEPVLNQRPQDYRANVRMARLQTHLYRLGLLPELRRQAPPEISLEDLWDRTSPRAVHEQIQTLARQGDTVGIDRLRGDDAVQTHLLPALRHYLRARAALPVRAAVHLRIAPLSVLVDRPEHDQVHLERAVECDPSNPDVLLQAGQLDWQAGRAAEALGRWHKALELDETFVTDLLDFADSRVPVEQLATKVLPDSPTLLLELATTRYVDDGQAAAKDAVLRRAAAGVERLDLHEDERYYLRGRILAEQNDAAEAIRNYLLAVNQRPGELAWRFELARLLRQNNLLEQAAEQVRRCLEGDPDRAEFKQLLEEIERARTEEANEIQADIP